MQNIESTYEYIDNNECIITIDSNIMSLLQALLCKNYMESN